MIKKLSKKFHNTASIPKLTTINIGKNHELIGCDHEVLKEKDLKVLVKKSSIYYFDLFFVLFKAENLNPGYLGKQCAPGGDGYTFCVWSDDHMAYIKGKKSGVLAAIAQNGTRTQFKSVDASFKTY